MKDLEHLFLDTFTDQVSLMMNLCLILDDYIRHSKSIKQGTDENQK